MFCFTQVKVRDGVWYRHINNFPEVNYYIRVRVSATLYFTEARVRLKDLSLTLKDVSLTLASVKHNVALTLNLIK